MTRVTLDRGKQEREGRGSGVSEWKRQRSGRTTGSKEQVMSEELHRGQGKKRHTRRV